MAGLFGGGGSKEARPVKMPSIDRARARVEALKRQRGLRGRAAALLVAGSGMGSMETAKRDVTGN